MIKIIFFAIGLGSCLMAPARAFARIELPFGSSVMFCGDPDSRDTAKDGTFTCVNYYKRAVKNATFTLKNGKLDGPAFGYSENDGAPVMEGHFKAGEKDGEFRENWSAEKKRFQEITHFRKGLREGIRLTQNDENDGQNISYYKNDQKFGYTLRLEGEKIANVSECEVAGQEGENSKCDSIIIPGYEKQWSAFKGVTAAKNEVAHNTANAFIEKKNAKGVLVERYQQKDNQIDGKHEIFYDNGKLHFLNVESASRIAEQSEYFDDGHLKRKSKFDLSHGGTGIETERFEFYQNGKPKLESKGWFVYETLQRVLRQWPRETSGFTIRPLA
jgi:antitoxin component YwqK of YwqJK toxin-antitoxin module